MPSSPSAVDRPVQELRRDRRAGASRLARLEAAHALLRRYAEDLKQAYEAERRQRACLQQATLELATALALTRGEP